MLRQVQNRETQDLAPALSLVEGVSPYLRLFISSYFQLRYDTFLPVCSVLRLLADL